MVLELKGRNRDLVMKYSKKIILNVIFCLTLTYSPLSGWGSESLPHPDKYLPHQNELYKQKKVTDDSTDLIAVCPLKNALPREIYNLLTFNVEEAKRQTAEILGFRSPDLVGKVAPEIKPGKYTFEDLKIYPGLKELFPPELELHIKPGGPPLIASIPEFEIIPTRQFFWYPKLCEVTRKNLGKTKLDKTGYIVPMSWQGGCPFPKPSEMFKAQQIYYNFNKTFSAFDLCYASSQQGMSYDKNLTMDSYSESAAYNIKFMGRTLFPPYGWFDKHAERNGDYWSSSIVTREPRSQRGTVLLNHKYENPDKLDRWMVYVPSLRRIRKMNPTDTQEPAGDMAYDDREHIVQKITPNRYPYKFEIIGDREYLLPIQYDQGKAWLDSNNGYALKEIQFMRRPCYVLQMTQLDTNYIYSKRIIYIDRESFRSSFSANYDQEGRLYRSQSNIHVFRSDTGHIFTYGTHTIQFDHLELHSSFQMPFPFPAPFERKEFSIEHLIKKGK
jgi:hypothetical protein